MNDVSWNHEEKQSAVNKNVFNANKCFNFKRFVVLYISVYKNNLWCMYDFSINSSLDIYFD